MKTMSISMLALVAMMVTACKEKTDATGSPAPTSPTPAVVTPTCESMCDHAIGCVASRLGVSPTGEVFRDGRSNCVAGCRGAPQETISCWSKAPCDVIKSEQGLTKKPCP